MADFSPTPFCLRSWSNWMQSSLSLCVILSSTGISRCRSCSSSSWRRIHTRSETKQSHKHRALSLSANSAMNERVLNRRLGVTIPLDVFSLRLWFHFESSSLPFHTGPLLKKDIRGLIIDSRTILWEKDISFIISALSQW